MGVYLVIIAIVDSYYRGVYILHEAVWTTGALCRLAGFLSMFSSGKYENLQLFGRFGLSLRGLT